MSGTNQAGASLVFYMLEDDFRSVREITVTIAVSFRYARAKLLGQNDLRLGDVG
jgi:hypothetical protein